MLDLGDLANAMTTTVDRLTPYRAKRDFAKTPEPHGGLGQSAGDLVFVIQKHAATRLHYDFRLELDGVMLSWAVPKGPSFDPQEKRMAVRVEDHPISYNTFEGTIPKGQYGAGSVLIWDRGTWTPEADPREGLEAGKLVFTLHGHKLFGKWELVRIGKPGDRQVPWILFKKHDTFERPKAEYDVVSALPDSVVGLPAPATASTRDNAPLSLSRAPRVPLPAKLGPQLATLSNGTPVAGEWLFEIKFDGYRLMARIEDGTPKLITRGGHDWSRKMPHLVADLKALNLVGTWLDGEIVVLGPSGVPEFNALQKAFDGRGDQHILYFLFDLPFYDGHDLRAFPLRERRRLLQGLLEKTPTERLRMSESFEADPASILESARKLNLEGVIAKRADAPYVSSRSDSWLKLKCRPRQEFVVGGFTDRAGDVGAQEIGSLLLGVYDGEQLRFAGGLGAGWDARTAAALKAQLVKLETASSPFSGGVPGKGRWARRAPGTERWVEPRLVVEASFADWTPDGHARHAKFEGVRVDKPAREVVREGTVTPFGAIPLRAAAVITKVTHPERVVDPSTGLTKLDVIRYYESVADRMLPHLLERPCSLVRAPEGVTGQLFFQKHLDTLRIAQVRELDPALWPGHAALIEVPTTTAIAGAAQMNVIEFHTWNSRVGKIDRPDRMIFDLDPGEGVPWRQVQEAALLTRSLLNDLGLQAWLKTSGGKGLHLVVPLAPRHDAATVKGVSRAVVQHLARVVPQRFVAKSGPSNRKGRIFVDYLRNGHAATTVAAFSARARPGLGVSMPVPWDDLSSLKAGAHWTIATAREHLSFESKDPWADYWMNRQSLGQALRLLDVDRAD
jgi:bifunctional non-homologous end joining protein LigD